MINNRQNGNGRRRGRGGNAPRPNGGGGNGPDRGNRIDNRSRGNANQLHEKYKTLARDAQMQGDRVMTEYYLQFADHYFRVLSEARSRFDDQSPRPRPATLDQFGDDDGEDLEGQGEEDRFDDRAPQQQQRYERNDRNDRGEGREPREGRDGQPPRDRGDRNDRDGQRSYQRDDRGERNGNDPRGDRDAPRNDQRADRDGQRFDRNDPPRADPPRREPRPPRADYAPRAERGSPRDDAPELPMAADAGSAAPEPRPLEERRPRRRPRVEANGSHDINGTAPEPAIALDRLPASALPPAFGGEPVAAANGEPPEEKVRRPRARKPKPETPVAEV